MEKRKHSDWAEEGATLLDAWRVPLLDGLIGPLVSLLDGLIGPLVSLLDGLIGPLVSLLGGLISPLVSLLGGLIAANPEAISPHRHEEHHCSDEDIEDPPHNPSESQGGSHTSFG